LNTSLALSAAELWLTKVWPERANYAFSELPPSQKNLDAATKYGCKQQGAHQEICLKT